MKRSEIKKRPLSSTVLDSLEPESSEYRELDSNSLYFRVQPNGKKGWLYRYKKPDGKWSWKGLGSYPKISAKLARDLAREENARQSNGEIVQTRQDLKRDQKEQENLLLKNLMLQWLDTKQSHWGEVTFDKAVKSINRHIMPKFGDRPFKGISANEWFLFFQGLQRNLGILTQVEKLTSYVRGAYDWAKFQGKMEYNPLDGITRHLDRKYNNNMKHVEIEELPELLRAIRGYPKRPLAIGLELFALLFPRPVELRFATWQQFDFDKKVWIKPAEVMKTGIIHGVPLPRQAIELLKELKTYQTGDLLFPSRDSLEKPISDNTFNMALNRLGYKDRQNPHGFRHIASTALNNKFSDKPQVVEACLAHLKRGVKGAYDKASHFEERIEMMQWWADYLEGL